MTQGQEPEVSRGNEPDQRGADRAQASSAPGGPSDPPEKATSAGQAPAETAAADGGGTVDRGELLADRPPCDFPANAPRIVTSRFRFDDSHTLRRYLTTGGYEALDEVLSRPPSEMIDAIKASNLAGRGGAGFPAGIKWGSFGDQTPHPRWLLVNGDESEPGTYKDRQLLERDPHQLIEGVLIAAYAIGASQAFIYVRGEMALAQERVATALNEAYAAGYVGKNIMGTQFSIDITMHWGAGAYIVGEESALMESIEGKRGYPRLKPPSGYLPTVKGLYMQPTLINNVETLSNVPWIALHGGEAFASLGNEKAKGTRMFALSGHVKRPGVYEVEQGTTTFRDLLYDPALGGGIREDRALKAFIPGGASAPWYFEEHLDFPLDDAYAKQNGSMLGSGAVVVMDETTDMVRAAWRLVRFFAKESCGKCTPCREGTSWLETIYQRILSGHGRPEDVDLLLDVTDNISPGLAWPPQQTTICVLGPSTASPILSSIRRFRSEYDAYVNGTATPAPAAEVA
jgi:NADH-quinone oxidoreductase subunit F